MGTVYTYSSTMNTFLLLSMISSSLCLPSDRVKGLLARIPNSCSTRTGDSCVFPFTYKGVEHYHCTYADSPTSWCATLTDSQGVVTNRWGDCDTNALSSCQEEVISVPSCTTTSGPYPSQPCVFPFRYNGITYSSCTTQDKSAAWCSTNTTLAGTHIPGYFGYCPSSCPGAETSSCTPGTSYTVDCNTCVCGADGTPVCTSNVCGSSTTTTTSTTTITTTTSSPSSTCTTVSGPATGAACVFPFTFSGTTYVSCTEWIYGGENQGSKWCSTKVDSQGVHVNGEGNYGFCGTDCNIDTVSLADILESLIGANARTSSQRNKDSVVFGNTAGRPK